MRAIFFDLDNCLVAADEAGQALYEPAFAAMRCANRGRLPEAALEAVFADCWRDAFDVVAARHGLPGEVFEAGWCRLRELAVEGPLRGYADLHHLERLPVLRFLVTAGFRRLQESKIAALRIAHLFAAIHVDAVDAPPRRGKEALFRDILARHGWRAAQVLVVGDNPRSEIAAGNRLGIPTVQILRPGVERSASAGAHIGGLAELSSMVACL